MCERVFVIAFGQEILGRTNSYEEAYSYITESFGEKAINVNNFNTFGQGAMDEWVYYDNPKIRVIDLGKDKIDPVKLLEGIDEEDDTVRVPKPVKPVKNIPTTPLRTRLITNKKTPPVDASKLKEGSIRKGADGTTWTNKKLKNGSFKWVKYYEETHEGLDRKRKAPALRAKEYEEGTVMKGADGNEWIVKKVKGNVFKWVKHN